MKLSFLYLSICAVSSITSMDNSPAYPWFTELVDVPMAAMVIPAHPAPSTTVTQGTSNPASSGPGMLQAIYDTINSRPSRTK